MDLDQKNYYEVLEISTDANSDEIHQGYIRAKNAYSQDSLALYSLMTQDECDRVLELIDEAYSILSDPNKRKQYDDVRGLNQGVNFQIPKEKKTDIREDMPKLNSSGTNSSENSMPKLVAKKKFALEYNVNNAFEQEIEQTTEFTGDFLKQIREYKQVDIVRMSELTKVSKTYIRYIEDEEFEKLPAPVYVRGFVFQYAKCLKLNPDLVATSYIYRLKRAREEA